jgi:CRP-like cAMP-binding protein
VADRLARVSAIESTLPRRDVQIARIVRRHERAPESLSATEFRRFWNEIGDSALVSALDDDSLGVLLDACEVQHWTPRSVVVRAGQSLARCYLLVEGGLEATEAGPDGSPIPLTRFLPGDVVGDGALVEDAPWPAAYRTGDGQPTTALRWTRRRLEESARDAAQRAALLAALRRHGRDRDVQALVRSSSQRSS